MGHTIFMWYDCYKSESIETAIVLDGLKDAILWIVSSLHCTDSEKANSVSIDYPDRAIINLTIMWAFIYSIKL